MKIKTQLTLATLMAMGLFATGCSQQTAGAAGAQQTASSAQQTTQATGSQQTTQAAQSSQSSQSTQSSQQAVADAGTSTTTSSSSGSAGGSTDSTTTTKTTTQQQKQVVRTIVDCSKCGNRGRAPAPAPRRAAPPRRYGGGGGGNNHTHPAIPGCTDSISHSHRFTNRNHRHKYSCRGQRRAAPRRAAPRRAAPRRAAPRRAASPYAHNHPAIPGCTDSIQHVHKFTNRNHRHKYSCRGQRRAAPRRAAPRRAAPRRSNPYMHTHPAIPGCTDSISHTHKYTNRNHSHKYSCRGQRRAAPRRAVQRPVQRPVQRLAPAPIVPRAIVAPKAKGNFKGPVLMSPETRAMMQQYQQ